METRIKYCRLTITANHRDILILIQYWDPIAIVRQLYSPTARYSDSLIGNIKMMRVGLFYFVQIKEGNIEIHTVQSE